MDIKEMTVESIQMRQSEIVASLDNADADLDALEQEMRTLAEELENRKAVESRKAEIRNRVAGGSGSTIETYEEKENKDMFAVDSKEYRNAWLENLQGVLPMEKRVDYGFTSSGNNGTHAVPTILADRFFQKMKKLAPMLSEITLLRVAGNVQFVAEGTRNTASIHTENRETTPVQDTTVTVSLGGFEFMKVIGISRAAQVMSVDAFEDWLVELLSGDIARALEDYILNNNTNGLAYTITTATSNTIVNTAATGYTYANMTALEALLPAAYDAEAKYLTTKKVLWGQIANIVNSSGQPIFVTDPATGLNRIFGREVVISDYATGKNGQNAIYLGKLTDIVGNLSQEIMVESSDDAGFTANQRLYKGTAVFDSKLAKKDAIVQLVATV